MFTEVEDSTSLISKNCRPNDWYVCWKMIKSFEYEHLNKLKIKTN
jgi:hypothetical protein